jgi:phosphoglycerate dehydrogenase-like enzyme
MSPKPKVILDPAQRRIAEIFADADLQRLHGLADVIWGRDEIMPEDEFLAAAPSAVAIICGRWRYPQVLELAVDLKAILEVGGGFPPTIDYDLCHQRRIRVLSCAPAFGPQVAEMALGLAIAAGREIIVGDSAMRAGREKWLHAGNETTFTLYGKTVGLIGYGGLARALRPLLAPFGCRLQVYDPWMGEGYLRSQGVEPVDLDTLLRTSRVVFVLAVPSSENRAMLSRETLELIQPGAVLALISRAHVVDFDALTDLVLAGRFRAAIDVFPLEPLPVDHPIRTAPNVVLSAHRAGSVREAMTSIGEIVVDDLECVLKGLPPQRMLSAQPELAPRYVAIGARRPEAR